MRIRLGFSFALVLATGLAAQAPKPAAPKPAAPAHPDLSGTYDVSTMTPVERLPGVKSLTFTKEEADAAEKYEANRQKQNDAALDPNRGAPPVGGERMARGASYQEQIENFAGGPVGGYNHFWLDEGRNYATIDGQKRSSIIIDPPDGHAPPMKPEAVKRNAELAKRQVAPGAAEGDTSGPPGAFDDPEQRPLAERCLLGFSSTSGPPALPNYFYNNLHQIVQTRDSIMILTEMVHDARVVRMNTTQHLPKTIRKWMGDSIGHWEGDTLVIDTTNFTTKTQFRGASEDMHVVERITRMPDGNLRYRFTVDDPSTWDRPWTGEYPWVKSSDKIYEYACHEGNHSLTNMMHGARVAEEEAAKAKTKK
ncbi:MAG TPA: hypothetical protein VFA59_16095 [Vicinamibacterales bacterium]|nr:hypothetical protein [Vicinamibacterales bacterium]